MSFEAGLDQERMERTEHKKKEGLFEPGSLRKAINHYVRSRKRKTNEGRRLARSWILKSSGNKANN